LNQGEAVECRGLQEKDLEEKDLDNGFQIKTAFRESSEKRSTKEVLKHGHNS
jgi:hypothetical protein